MTKVKVALALVLTVAVGCSGTTTTGGGKPGDKDGTPPKHVHGEGPHKGIVFDLGKHHAELTVDHDKKEVALYILGEDEKTAVEVMAEDLTLHTQQTMTKDKKEVPAMAIKLKADGAGPKASKFVGTDPGLGMEAEHTGTVTGKIDGKPVTGKFEEE